VRPAYIFGRSVIDSNRRADVYFLQQALNKENIVMYSKGEQVRSYCYVDDCVSGLLYVLLKGGTGEVYNIGNPNGTISMHDYAQKIADNGGVRLIYNPETKPAGTTFLQTKQLILAVDKLEGLGWKAQYSIDEGLKDIFENGSY
jgi:nucleoside-diphosphate-sugar epimerase